jgi:hypothetical protein
MQVQVDFRKWAAYLGLPDEDFILKLTPTVDVDRNASVYDALDLALQAAMKNAQGYDKLNPFRSTHELWVLGCPAVVEFNGRALHFIDSIDDLASTSDTITLTLRPRKDIRAKSDALGRLSDRFGDAIGLRSRVTDLHVAVVDKIFNMLDERFAPTIRDVVDSFCNDDVNDAVQLFEKELRKPITEFLRPTTDWIVSTAVDIILRRPEISFYNEFSAKHGLEWVLNYWLPFCYPSRVWREIEKGEGPTLLSEIGSRLWRFNILRQRDALTPSDKVDDSVDRSIEDNILRGRLGPSDFLKPDETAGWWFEKETLALRYYLIGILSFPESFLGLLKNDDIQYGNELKEIFGINDALKKIWESLLPADNEIHTTKLLQQAFEGIVGSSDVVLKKSDPAKFINAQQKLQREIDKEHSFRFLVLLSEFRNALVHGTMFKQTDIGSLQFTYKDKQYVIDFETLAFAYYLLPAAVVKLHRAYTLYNS